MLISKYYHARDCHIFDHSLTVASHRIPTIAILCIFIESIQQVHHLGRKSEKKKKATENDIERRACRQKSHVPLTNSSMYFLL